MIKGARRVSGPIGGGISGVEPSLACNGALFVHRTCTAQNGSPRLTRAFICYSRPSCRIAGRAQLANPAFQRVDCGGVGNTIRGIDMASERDLPDLKRLEAQLLAEREAYYDRVAAQRGNINGVQKETSEDLHAFLQERLQRLLGLPARG